MMRPAPLLFVCLLAAAAPAAAQLDEASARALFEQGVEHASRGEWEGAHAAFRGSFERYPRGRTLFNVAVALDRLDRGAACLRAIDALLARDDVDPADRAEAEQLLERWRPRVGALVLRVQPPDATVRIDGERIEGEGSPRRIWVDPGRHRLTVEGGPSLAPQQRQIELGAGGEARVEVSLTPAVVEGAVQLRPLDRATVRLIGIRGAQAVQRTRGSPATVVPLAAHGSGVAIGSGGWILTARHVVEGADRVVALLPGETRAIATRTVWLDPEHDLALVRAAEPLPTSLEPSPPPPLVAGQAVQASGYPLDPVERWPNASSGSIGRPLNDGRVQLSIALNPGNSGGPIAVDGQLIGVVSQGGDPGRGVQGVAVMEPVAPILEAIHGHLASPAPAPAASPADDVLVELIGAAQPPPLARRIARLREAAEASPTGVTSALWAFEAEATRRAILSGAAVSMPASLPADLRASYDELTNLGSAFARGLGADPAFGARYQPLRALSATVRQGRWDCGYGGVCAQRVEPRPRGQGWLFDLTLAGGLAIEGVGVDAPANASFVEGAVGSILGLFHLGNFGRLDPVRFNVVVGSEVSVGSWRGEVVFDWLADVGVRFEIGTPDVAVAAQLLYTPGIAVAENRWAFAYLAYRATLALQLRSFAVGLSWREMGRQADDTQRSWELFLSWGL